MRYALLALALSACAHRQPPPLADPRCPDLSRGCHPGWELANWYQMADTTEGSKR